MKWKRLNRFTRASDYLYQVKVSFIILKHIFLRWNSSYFSSKYLNWNMSPPTKILKIFLPEDGLCKEIYIYIYIHTWQANPASSRKILCFCLNVKSSLQNQTVAKPRLCECHSDACYILTVYSFFMHVKFCQIHLKEMLHFRSSYLQPTVK